MITVLAIVILILLGVIVWIAVKSGGGQGRLIESEIKEKTGHKAQVLELFMPGKRISNNDVQNALGVSDATAERYLNELEKEGKIRQVGKTGASVTYTLAP